MGRARQPGGAPSAWGSLGATERSPIAPAGLRLALCPGCSWGAVLSPSPPSSPCRDIRLIEVTENICKRLLDYNLHKERSGSNRFAKVRAVLQSPTPKHPSPTPALPGRRTGVRSSHPLDPLPAPSMRGRAAPQVRCGVLSLPGWAGPCPCLHGGSRGLSCLAHVFLLFLRAGLQQGTRCHLNSLLVTLMPQGP